MWPSSTVQRRYVVKGQLGQKHRVYDWGGEIRCIIDGSLWCSFQKQKYTNKQIKKKWLILAKINRDFHQQENKNRLQ